MLDKPGNKYEYLFVVQGHYRSGWEDLTASESYREARDDLRAYHDNTSDLVRLIQRREKRDTGGASMGISTEQWKKAGLPLEWWLRYTQVKPAVKEAVERLFASRFPHLWRQA